MEMMILLLTMVAIIGVVVAAVILARSLGNDPVAGEKPDRQAMISRRDIRRVLFWGLVIGVIFSAAYVYVEYYGNTGRQAAMSSCQAVAGGQGLEIAWQADEKMQVGPGIGRSGAPQYFRYFDGWTPSGDRYSCHTTYDRSGSRTWSAAISQEREATVDSRPSP